MGRVTHSPMGSAFLEKMYIVGCCCCCYIEETPFFENGSGFSG
jgi:hypothetical protein